MFDKLLELFFGKYDDIVYAVAYGSYGRGEETYIFDSSGTPALYNDIDLILVVNNKVAFSKNLDKLKTLLRAKLNTYWIDILLWDLKDLQKKRKTIFFYDFCHGHKLFKGNKNTFEQLINPIDVNEITPSDVYNMYITRMWALLSLYGDAQPDNTFPIDIFKSYQCAKVIFAIVDFITLSHGEYVTLIKSKLRVLNKGDYTLLDVNLERLALMAQEIKDNPKSTALNTFLENEKNLLLLHRLYLESFDSYMTTKSNSSHIHIFFIELKNFMAAAARSLSSLNATPFRQFTHRRKILKLTKTIADDYSNVRNSALDLKINELLSRSFQSD